MRHLIEEVAILDIFTIKQALRQTAILGAASEQNIEKYLTEEKLTLIEVAAGEQILSPLTKGKHVGILLSGTAVASPGTSSQHALLKVIDKGDIFGIANLYAQTAVFPSTICAKTACTVLFIDGEAFMALIENDRQALISYLGFLSDRVVYLNRKISTLTAGDTEKKLASFLAKNERDGEFSQSISMSALADMLNIGRASLYRALDALSASGLIVRQGKKILIPDKNALLNLL
jgi:CRP-like cAMP-binding protein